MTHAGTDWLTDRRERMDRGRWQTSHLLVYQPAEGGDPDTAPVLERCFRTEDEARAWAEGEFVVPLGLDEVEMLIGDNGRVLHTLRRQLDY
jgi:hypothetical protein